MDKGVKKLIDDLDENYIPIKQIHLNEDGFIYLGEKNNRVCRFCDKKVPDVSFNKVAHAIPEFTNNHRLISYYECDSCNEKFSKLLETHMGDYMNIHHSLSQVRGKKGVPSFRAGNERSRIDMKETGLNFKSYAEDSHLEFDIDETNKTVTVKGTRATYIPIAIYKCLTKMAISIMPESELHNYLEALDWINEENHDKSKYKISNLIAMFSFAPGPLPYSFTTCLLWKRKENAKLNVPHMIFLLAYGNYSFQIYLPLCKNDKILNGTNVSFLRIPTSFEFENGILNRKQIDFSCKKKVKGEKVQIQMQFDEMKELDINEEDIQ